MPYIKPKPKAHDAMGRLLRGYEMTGPRLATVLGCCENTARAKLEDPGRLTLVDLDRIRRLGHIPAEEIREKVLI